MSSILHSKKALSIIEVVVSLTILSVVLLTYGSATSGKKTMIRSLTEQSLYQRLANVQLERVLNFIHSNQQESKNYASSSKTDLSTGTFHEFTKIFSQEGKSSGLDEFDDAKSPAIPLLQLYVKGTDYGTNSYLTDANSRPRFLAFPYPNELRDESVYDGKLLWPQISNASGTFHHITPLLNEDDAGSRKYRGVLPLVSEEYLVDDGSGDLYELGFGGSGALAAEDVQLSAGLQLFVNPTVIGNWDNERIRRYVYYRKIREGNLVFRRNVIGRGSSALESDVAHITTSQNVKTETDIDMLYVQSLNDWTDGNGSSNDGNVTGIKGKAYQDSVGGAGAHSIYVMVVVRALEAKDIGPSENSVPDPDFIDRSTVKAVAVGIASPTYGKNLLKSMELSYHRYSWTRIPGIKMHRQ